MARTRRPTTDQDAQPRSREGKEDDEIDEMEDEEQRSQEGDEYDSEDNNSNEDELSPSAQMSHQRSQSNLWTAAAEIARNAPNRGQTSLIFT